MAACASTPLFSDIRLRDFLKAHGSVNECSRLGREGEVSVRVPRLMEETITVAPSAINPDCADGGGDTDLDHARMRLTVVLSFEGDPILLRCRPSKYAFSPPRATVIGNEIHLTYSLDEVAVNGARSLLASDISEINQWLSWLDEDLKSKSRWAVGRVPAGDSTV